MQREKGRGVVIAAPQSGSGKTLLSLAIAASLRARGFAVAPAKTGPDYIDPAFLALAAGGAAVNLDPWAMDAPTLRALAHAHAAPADLLLVEGVMGLFDGSLTGAGSTADLAATLDLPVVLVLDCEKKAQSVAALVHGFAHWRADVTVCALILNKVASPRHEAMLRAALEKTAIPVLGAVPRDAALSLPERHLGLVLPAEIPGFADRLAAVAAAIAAHLDLEALLALARPLQGPQKTPPAILPPLGLHTAIARDAAFAFLYPHLLDAWRAGGAAFSFFSPLADEAPDPGADAVFLPGGYPELHAPRLAGAATFREGLVAARDRGALIYGECGGFMVLGETLADRDGTLHPMTGLLPLATRIDRPVRTLGYRRLRHRSPLPWPPNLLGHEFHYSSASPTGLAPLFAAADAAGVPLPAMGAVSGRVMGSYAHVIAHVIAGDFR